jgi:hypothetical protein
VRAFRPARLAIAAGAVLVLAAVTSAGTFAGTGMAQAASRVTASKAVASAPAAAFTVTGELNGVAVTSPSNAWAVGYSGTWPNEKSLIVHWNGKAWTQPASPKFGFGDLFAVDAVSADDVWAVGCTSKAEGVSAHILLLHWNGKRWSMPSGLPAISGQLDAVTVAGGDVWAVGSTGGNDIFNPLVVRLFGGHWYFDPVPTPKGGALWGVAATSPSSVWAYGHNNENLTGALLHWTGAAWRSVSFPLQSSHAILVSIAADPAGTVWVVGYHKVSGVSTAASMRWTGKTWQQVLVPNATDGSLNAVSFIPGGTATRGGTAWAVGWSVHSLLALRWTGQGWTPVATPSEGGFIALFGVAASSTRNAWAVGTSGSGHTLIIHWNGSTWS